MIRTLLLVACLAALAHAQSPEPGPLPTTYELAKSAYDQATMPKGSEEILGWFGGRWFELERAVRGTLVGIESVPEKRDDAASPQVLIMATWSHELATSWDATPPAELTRSQDMLRRGPRDGTIAFDEKEKAAVILGKWDDGKFRYSYSLRVVGRALAMRYDYEHRKISYGFFHRRIMDAITSKSERFRSGP